ncbi:hypothetical protein [Allopontixanthobacter sediminis]|uniref:hypothetical protein n=1 Tax=Allopontixanthobacter sediminis TaxID=1689985 RepID=UPI001925A43A|nr:hypothetical protein [Allopontixanthobacter sediminis]
MRKVPTAEEFAAFKGAHCHQLWARVGPDWICPSCRRSKFQILRWTKRFPNSDHPFLDWLAALHEHHDHARSWDGVGTARFNPTVLCDQCNAADGVAKRRLKLPENFSFTPTEIGQFVTSQPHGKHVLDLAMAERIYRSLWTRSENGFRRRL